jgi:disulfide bond formation protein DsbB
MPHRGANLRDSTFIAARDDRQLMAFIKKGRLPGDADSVDGLFMPPRGGNPALDDAHLAQIVTILRQIQREARHGEQVVVAADRP